MNKNDPTNNDPAEFSGSLGLVDGSVPASTRRFFVVLADNAVAQLDELVVTMQTLPDGTELRHYGIVVEGIGEIEGAELPSDTHRITAARTMPGITSRRVEVQILRSVPELWLAPEPGATVARVLDAERREALFLDQMEHPLPIGLDQGGAPLYADFAFLNGEKGGHASISGISGVATKTSYALFLLYMLFETPAGRALLGPAAPTTRALVFNVKGEDLLHIDRPNARYTAQQDAPHRWHALGVDEPGPFRRVRLYAPRSPRCRRGAVATDIVSREADDVLAYGWSPETFIRQGLLRFCFTAAEDARTQISFVEQRVRVQLARWTYPLEGEEGAVVLAEPPVGCSYNFERVVEDRRDPKPAGAGTPIRNFSDLIDFLTIQLAPDDLHADPAWTGSVQPNTLMAFLRRLYALAPRLGHLLTVGVHPVELDEPITVVDIHSLHDDAQRFVVGALLSQVFEEKQGRGREPLRFIVLDELNKYAPRQGTSPMKELLVDIAARGRSLGVLLIGAQQSAADVDGSIIRNAALKIVGRLDAGEASEYKFLTSELRERAARFLPGTMVVDQPLIPAPLPFRFPFPSFATCIAEDEGPGAEELREQEREAFERL
ncbi:ATP-binding protein [Mycobacterium marinum]|uniref:ATP-binding protein n=1 Tax=Mycobacterium marinum TaxID=1781 RepID=UPI003569E514